MKLFDEHLNTDRVQKFKEGNVFMILNFEFKTIKIC
jgi:hypothetical protein